MSQNYQGLISLQLFIHLKIPLLDAVGETG